MARGRMTQKTKPQLRAELDAANAEIVRLNGELLSVRENVASGMTDAPVLCMVGLNEEFEPFMDCIKPARPPVFALDIIASHISRMASSSHFSNVGSEQAIESMVARVAELEKKSSSDQTSIDEIKGEISSLTLLVKSLFTATQEEVEE